MDQQKKISVLIGCYNEEENLSDLYRRVTDVMAVHPEYDYEIILVPNRLKGFFQYTFPVRPVQHFNLRADQVDMGRNHMQLREFSLNQRVRGRNLADQDFV